ncbi:MAG: polysaccharide deacetylase family protein [Sphingobacteriia bacterium]|nr:polysaccharide deacetylase family protein [Sphingobacteriia bacterium]
MPENIIKIKISAQNFEEKKYVIDCILRNFLGLDYHLLVVEEAPAYEIIIRDKKIILADEFFSRFKQPQDYLSIENIPNHVVYARIKDFSKADLPILYGNDAFITTEDGIYCGIDLFATVFFMLSRWEEVVNQKRDLHDRFPAVESIAYKHNFLTRPIVNEYIELFWKMLKSCGYRGDRKRREFKLYLTHDIDHLFTPISSRQIVSDLIKRLSVSLAIRHFQYKYLKNPYNQYDFLMDCSEKMNVQSHFYFKASTQITRFDQDNYLETKEFFKIIQRIKSRGHLIGFHPGYDTYRLEDRWVTEKLRLEDAIQQDLKEGRQHYLRMDVSKTLQIWENHRMETDSTLGYADKFGYRCGTGDEFPLFDLIQRKEMNLKERPLIAMDGTLKISTDNSPEKALQITESLIRMGEEFQMGMTLLFHNSSFEEENWNGWKAMYRTLTH